MTSEATATKIYENRLRRAADRQGLMLSKSRTRDPLAINFGVWYIYRGRRQLASFTELADIEHWLLHPASRVEAG
jgi:hypothetical protein